MRRFDTLADLQEFLSANAEGMAADTMRSALASREKRADSATEVATQIRTLWADGLVALDAVVFAMGQNGLHMLQRLDEVDERPESDPHQVTRIVLTLHQFNGLIILQEIEVLLRAGFWAGAAARWRALHEVAVSARVIAESSPAIAQRYLDHGFVVQTRRLARYFDAHGTGPVGQEELVSRQESAAELERHHELANSDSKFRDQYGWAIPLLPKTAKGRYPRPGINSLERLAGLDQRRLLVESAHGMVHADSGGVGGVVLLGDGEWLAGPTERFVETVARPTLESLIHLVGATHVGFEPEHNETCELLSLFAAGLMALCGGTIEKFSRKDSS